ncbi:MAG TPA: ATP-binding protein, partial [Azospirillaceae bacterium]|nr:ATP-binding protein [Azospirillaceae bacterium]
GTRPVAFAEAVAGAIALVRGASCAATIDIHARLVVDHGQVDASTHEVFQVLSHLVANAARAMDGVGVVDIQLERAELAAGDHFRMTVADTGRGMDTDTLAHLSAPFPLAKSAERQAGLGLSLVRHLVTRWQGALEVSSLPGRGTTITLSVPVL